LYGLLFHEYTSLPSAIGRDLPHRSGVDGADGRPEAWLDHVRGCSPCYSGGVSVAWSNGDVMPTHLEKDFDRLGQTNFRVAPELLESLLDEYRKKK